MTEKTTTYTIRKIPTDQYRLLRIMAAEQEISINALLLRMIDDATKKRREPKINRGGQL